MADPIQYYTVLEIATGYPCYKGPSLYGAALALEPGTVYGTNTAQAGATLEAKRQRKSLIGGRKCELTGAK